MLHVKKYIYVYFLNASLAQIILMHYQKVIKIGTGDSGRSEVPGSSGMVFYAISSDNSKWWSNQGDDMGVSVVW